MVVVVIHPLVIATVVMEVAEGGVEYPAALIIVVYDHFLCLPCNVLTL